MTWWRSCTRWTSIFFECCVVSMRYSKLKTLFKQTWRSLSTTFRRSWWYTIYEILQRFRRRRHFDCCCYCRCHCRCFYRFFFFVCCFDRHDLIDFFDFNDFDLNENACFDIRSSRDNNVRNECNISIKW